MRVSAVSTECSVRKSAAATSRFVPAVGDQQRDATLGFGEVATGRGAAADARQLGARLLGPERGAECFEARERVFERHAGRPALLRTALRPAEREQRPRLMEWIRGSRVLRKCALEAREARVEITARCLKESPAAGEDREGPRAVDRGRPRGPTSRMASASSSSPSGSAPRAGRRARRAVPARA